MKSKKIIAIILATATSLCLLTGCNSNKEDPVNTTVSTADPYDIDIYKSEDLDKDGNPIRGKYQQTTDNNVEETTNIYHSETIIHFIDVGQADCSLIQFPSGKNILIDGGNVKDGKDLVKYLKALNVPRIDIMIATHPHEDHIGGLIDVINAFEVSQIYMPNIPEKYLPTTRVYENFLTAIVEKEIPVTNPKNDEVIFSGDGTLKCLYDGALGTNDYNEYSLVVRMDYYNISAMFTGDAGTSVEESIIYRLYKKTNNFFNFFDVKYIKEIDIDILKVGHHGSLTSTSENWLRLLSPSHAIIPCELNNEYGHPHDAVIQRLENQGVTTYDMRETGSVIIMTNGYDINVYENITGDFPLGNENYDDTLNFPFKP